MKKLIKQKKTFKRYARRFKIANNDIEIIAETVVVRRKRNLKA